MAIVRHVGVGHKKAPRADYRLRLRPVRAVRRGVLAKDVVVADPQPGRLPSVFEILRRFADHATGIKAVMRADGGQTGQIDVWPDDTVRTDLHAFIDYSVRSNLNRRVQFRPEMYDSGWMDHKIRVRQVPHLPSQKSPARAILMPRQARNHNRAQDFGGGLFPRVLKQSLKAVLVAGLFRV